jgi:tetratricopeptide (TPR) repeat protein
VAFDDDFQVYANPFLNPPTLQSVARLWAHAYQQLYIPLAYTILAVVARFAGVPAHVDTSIGASISVDPTFFHVVGVALHFANAWLCFSLVRRLTGRSRAALICSLVFALHPLQVESVAWISELRGLTSAGFALLALNAFVRSRQETAQARSYKLLVASMLLAAAAMLCKPSAAVLPLIALLLDRVVFQTGWRKALMTSLVGFAVVLPFVLITHAIQSIPVAAHSNWWQRPFIVGDSLAFYVFKTFVPTNLCVDYGRTPAWLMSHAWSYLTWIVPAVLVWIAYRRRRRRPNTWLGALLFLAFLLPTLGVVPFAYQAYSTVADRYAYLALIGVGLMISDALEELKRRTAALRVAAVLFLVLAILSFRQGRHWSTSSAFLRHTVDVNPTAGFAFNNLGDIELANGDLTAALADYKACVEREPTRTKAYINLAEVYTALNQPAEAERAVAQAMAMPDITADDLSNLGIVLMKMNRPDRALEALSRAVQLGPRSPTYLFNQANALAAVGQFDQAEAVFRRCIEVAPTLAGAHTGLGIVLAETQRLSDAVAEFRTAVHLQPNDPAALDNLKRAEDMLQQRAN